MLGLHGRGRGDGAEAQGRVGAGLMMGQPRAA